MARYTGPKHRLSRRAGFNLTGTRSKSLARRLQTPPGAHGRKRKTRQSEYGKQLRAKQSLKQYYGMTEGPFRRAFEQAMSSAEPTGEAFLTLLESRLDNVVYRLGFTPTRPMARQLVNHGHVLVNGRKVDIPSYRVSPGERITVSERAAAIPDVVEAVRDGGRRVPSWLEREGERPVGRVIAVPNPEEAGVPVDIEAIISFYARM